MRASRFDSELILPQTCNRSGTRPVEPSVIKSSPNTTPTPPARGFSLIELLVTISIITVLIGILLPTLPRVRDAARRTACGVNLRSVGQAVELYKNDFKEVFPIAKYMPRPWLSGDQDPSFNEALSRYIESDSEAWTCPGDKVVHVSTFLDDTGTDTACEVSYTYVSGVGGQRFEQTFFATRVNLPADETPIAHDFDGGTFEREDGDLVPVDFFHSTRNLLFADGSVGGFD